MSTAASQRSVSTMSPVEKLEAAIRYSLVHLSPEARAQVEGLLTPSSLGIMAGVGVAWIGSHAFGVGEIADAILLIGGGIALGWSVFSLAEELYEFFATALRAQTERDLESAGDHFARAVAIGGVTLITALITHGAARSLRARVPQTSGPAPSGKGLFSPKTLIRDPSLPAGEGSTGPYGQIRVSPHGPANEQRLVELHEKVHQFLSPRFRLLQELRADFGMHMYNRSVLLRYLEEAMAETYAQLRVNGFSGAIDGLMFPLRSSHYQISIVRLGLEAGGASLGTMIVWGVSYGVYLVAGRMQNRNQRR